MRVLFDANVLISYLLFPKNPGTITTIFNALEQRRFDLLLPEMLLKELLVTIAQKPKLTTRITRSELKAFQKLLIDMSEPIPWIDEPFPTLCRDPNDDYLLAYAVVGEANYLVTGDDGLLTLKQVGNVQIIAPAAFARLLS